MKKSRKLFGVFTALMCISSFCFSVSAAEVTGNELRYGDYLSYEIIDQDSDGTADSVAITGCDKSAAEIDIPDEVDGLPVTKIGDNAFYQTNITNIVIPDSVTKIGEHAFALTNITSVVIPDSVTEMEECAFFGCTKLTYVTISKNLASLEKQVFSFCDSLKSVYIPDNITKLGQGVFYKTPIEEINIPDSITEIGSNAFASTNITSVVIPETATEIGSNPFEDTPWMAEKLAENPMFIVNNILVEASGCKGDVFIPKEVQAIADNAFEGSEMTSVYIPKSVTKLGIGALSGCKNLTSIALPDSITSMGNATLSSNKNLVTVKLPKNIKELPVNLFLGCDNLKNVKFPENLKTIPEGMFIYCDRISEIVIPDSVTTISDYAFLQCMSLKNITIPESVNSIGRDVFKGTAWLENRRTENPLVIVNDILIDGTTYSGELVIPENVTKISNWAFCRCFGLEKVIIPKYVTEISSAAFYSCYNLKEVTIENPDCIIEDEEITFTNNMNYASVEGDEPLVFNGVIYCYENSTAHEYAVKYNRDYSIIEGKIDYQPIFVEQANKTKYTVRDCAAIAYAVANRTTDTLAKKADFNSDGIINIRDAAAIARSLAEK